MVYITGDCHADFSRFSTKWFPDQNNMTRDDIVIVLGDFGGVWCDTHQERHKLDWLAEKNFTLVFVDGNHECFDRLYSDEFPIVDFHGGKAHQIRENIFHLIRGNVFTFEGKKFFAFGGAKSHDICDGVLREEDYSSFREMIYNYNQMVLCGKMVRVEHCSWWKAELPSQEEMDFALKTLKKHKNRVDYIISHCAPQNVAAAMGFYEGDILTKFFDTIDTNVQFDKWFFGHYHENETIMCKYNCLYERIERII